MARFLRRQVTYVLRPPVAFPAAPPASFVADPLRSHLAPPVRTRTRSRLNAPAVVASAAAPFVASSPKVTKAPHPRQARQAQYALSPPASLVPAATPFLASPPRSVYGTATRRAVEQRRTRSKLQPPSTLATPVVGFVAPPERLSFRIAVRRATEQHYTTSALFPPDIVSPAAVVQQTIPGPAVKLVRPPRQGRVTRFKLAPPSTLSTGFVARPLALELVRSPRQGRTVRFRLAPPATLTAAPVLPPFRALQTVFATATKRANQRRQYTRHLSPPTVVDPAASGDNPTGGVFDPNYFLILHP